MRKIPGFADRLRQAFRWNGFWDDRENKPEVPRFVELHRGRYRDRYLYEYFKTRVPDYPKLKELAQDLHVPMTWLACGEDAIREVEALGRFREAIKSGRSPLIQQVQKGTKGGSA